MKKTVIFCALVFLCCACGTIKYVPIESVRTEYRNTATTDSIYLRDSIFVKEKGDTLIVEKYRYLYRDKILRDSIFKTDTIRVPYPVEVIKEVKKPLTGWQNFQVWCGRISLMVGLFGIVYFVRKLKKKRLF
jgi:hypothetical protein